MSTTFDAFQIPEAILKALKGMQYTTPTPIQQGAIPPAMQGKDVIGLAQTGTGKTAAFGIPLITSLTKDPHSIALILAPTRELALQIQEVMKQLAWHIPSLKTVCLIGGASMHWQVQDLRQLKPRIIIATPGRLLDHLNQKTVSLKSTKIVVLDEADRMLDIGFEPQLRKIFQMVPQVRQTLLFSATFPENIDRLAKQLLKNPIKVGIGKVAEPAKLIQQSFVKTTTKEKNNVLMKELKERAGTVLIFARTKHRTDRLTRLLVDAGIKADRIHGNRTQSQRVRALDNFRKERVRVLVATDIASRGIDIPHIAHVINYDLPKVPEDYVHRIGRTARAGAEGKSLCLITPEENQQWKALSRHLGHKDQPHSNAR